MSQQSTTAGAAASPDLPSYAELVAVVRQQAADINRLYGLVYDVGDGTVSALKRTAVIRGWVDDIVTRAQLAKAPQSGPEPAPVLSLPGEPDWQARRRAMHAVGGSR